MTTDGSVSTLVAREGQSLPVGRSAPGARLGRDRRRVWFTAVVLAVIWALWRADAGPGSINGRGWPLVREFFAAAAKPDVSADFLSVVADSVGVTVAYAVAGTSLSVVIGIVGGVATSETWWRRDPQHPRGPGVAAGWWIARSLAAVPRGVHEAIWALFLLQILGRDPLVAVLAIGVPFGAITAKVVAELVDDAASGPYDALRAAGAGRLTAMTYALAPVVGGDVTSYAFYRLECSLRSAVVLGMIGAGGIGFQLSLSFQTLRYEEIWTLVYTLVLLSALVDRWSAQVRARPTSRRRRSSIAVTTLGSVVAAWHLELRPQTLVSSRTRSLAIDVVQSSWPPRLPSGGWSVLWDATVDTLVISLIAIATASALAGPTAIAAARSPDAGVVGAVIGAVARVLLLVTRAIPPPVWALIVVFVVFPGPLAGGLALGVYTFGVLGRLAAEVIENADQGPAHSLRLLGAGPAAAFGYGTLPMMAPRLAALSLYRWEVAMRETVIVGLVGSGGLGRILAQQNAAFDRAAMVTTVAALIVLALLADVMSARMRADLR
ncbi:MAG: ABC transporter permease subunit [Actinomycetota bacterium]